MMYDEAAHGHAITDDGEHVGPRSSSDDPIARKYPRDWHPHAYELASEPSFAAAGQKRHLLSPKEEAAAKRQSSSSVERLRRQAERLRAVLARFEPEPLTVEDVRAAVRTEAIIDALKQQATRPVADLVRAGLYDGEKVLASLSPDASTLKQRGWLVPLEDEASGEKRKPARRRGRPPGRGARLAVVDSQERWELWRDWASYELAHYVTMSMHGSVLNRVPGRYGGALGRPERYDWVARVGVADRLSFVDWGAPRTLHGWADS
jgi:hypothetical protein